MPALADLLWAMALARLGLCGRARGLRHLSNPKFSMCQILVHPFILLQLLTFCFVTFWVKYLVIDPMLSEALKIKVSLIIDLFSASCFVYF